MNEQERLERAQRFLDRLMEIGNSRVPTVLRQIILMGSRDEGQLIEAVKGAVMLFSSDEEQRELAALSRAALGDERYGELTKDDEQDCATCRFRDTCMTPQDAESEPSDIHEPRITPIPRGIARALADLSPLN